MIFKRTMIPTLFIIAFMIGGIWIASIIKIRIDPLIYCAISFLFALLALYLSFGKMLSAVVLGMCIQSESQMWKMHGTINHSLSMKCIVRGVIKEVTQKNSFIHCIIQGYIDTPQLPRIEQSRILIRMQHIDMAFEPGMIIYARGIAITPKQGGLQGEFNQRAYLQSKNILLSCSVKKQDLAIIHKERSSLRTAINHLRSWLDHTLEELFPKESLPLAKGILLGETSTISSEMRNAFALLGTAHILSVSGFHAGIIALMILFVLSWIPSHFLKNTLLIIALILFLEIVQWDPPALRACMMTAIGSILHSMQRKVHPLHLLLTVGGIMLCLEPSLISSIGFQMSMIGMFGLITLTDYFQRFHIQIFQKEIATSFSSSLAAMIALLPISAYYFETIPLLSPFANLIFIPLFTLALCWTLMAVLFSSFSTVLGKLFALSAHQAISIAEELHIIIAKCNWITLHGEHALWMACAIIASIMLIYRSRNTKQFILSVFCTILFLIGMYDMHSIIGEELKHGIHRRNDVIAGIFGKKIFIMDRDNMRLGTNDKAFIEYIAKNHSQDRVIFAGNCAKKIASSIHRLDSCIHIQEYDRNTIKRCINLVSASSHSRK